MPMTGHRRVRVFVALKASHSTGASQQALKQIRVARDEDYLRSAEQILKG